MKAWQLDKLGGTLRCNDIPIPQLREGSVLVKMEAAGAVAETMQADWADGTYAEYALVPKALVTPVDNLSDISSEQLIAVMMRYAVPFGGLLRGKLQAGETIVVNGATGAYGSAAVLLSLAMGAARVVAAGRNAEKLKTLVQINSQRIVGVALSGNVETDVQQLREAANGGAHIAFDMVGSANSPNATLAALRSLRRNGRLVLMGSMTVPLPISYMDMMFNNWEIIGQFMYPQNAYLKLADLIRSGLLDISSIQPVVFPFDEFFQAMDAAAVAPGNECIVIKM
jgi:alcohol dehydrogenase